MDQINSEIVVSINNFFGDNILSYENEFNNLVVKEMKYLCNIKKYNSYKRNIINILNRILEIKSIDPNIFVENFSFLFYACNNIEICKKTFEIKKH